MTLNKFTEEITEIKSDLANTKYGENEQLKVMLDMFQQLTDAMKTMVEGAEK